jgi:hypothetical protein
MEIPVWKNLEIRKNYEKMMKVGFGWFWGHPKSQGIPNI